MALRRVPKLASGGARLTAMLSVVVMAACSGVLLGTSGSAIAGTSAAPSVALRVTGTESVTVTGRTATASPRVRFQRRTSSGWAFVKRTRAHAHRYTTTLTVVSGTTQTFRVTSNHRSRKFVVSMPARIASTAKPPAPVQYDACGARPRKADGSAWSCTFQDDFEGVTLDRGKWLPQTAFASGDTNVAVACYQDSPANVAVASGMLHLTVRKEAADLPCGSSTSPYTAGGISTYHLFSQQYGRFEARIRNASADVPGLQEAFWLWPDDRVPSAYSWPDAGEIDISETYSYYQTLSVPFLHYSADKGGSQPGVNTAWNCRADRGQWNTYTLEWTATRLDLFVNGTLCLTNTSGDPAFRKPYIVLLTAGLGQGQNALTSRTPIPATMDVDYIRVWR